MRYKQFKPKVYKIRDARANFSKIVKTAGKSVPSYLIKNRDAEGVVIINVETAKEYLPKKYWNTNKRKETGGERFARVGMEMRKEIENLSKGKPKENLSEKIDEIVYGI